MKKSSNKYFKLSLSTGAQTSQDGWPCYFCEECLHSEGHKHLLRDWFVIIEPTNEKKCCSYRHKKRKASEGENE